MSDSPLLLSSRIPSSCPIKDLSVVDAGAGPQVVCADSWGAVWTWEPLRDEWRKRPLVYAFTGDPLAAQYPDAENEIDTVAAAVFKGRVVLAAGGGEQSPALWDLESGELLRGTTYDEPYVGAIATLRGEGAPRFVTGSQYVGQLLVWEPSGQVPPVEVANDLYDITSLAAAWIDGRSLVASGGDGVVDVRDPARNEQVASFTPDDGDVRAVALSKSNSSSTSASRLGDRPLVVAATDAAELYVWELSGNASGNGDHEPVHDPITGHEDDILTLDTAAVGDRRIAVTGAADQTVRVWDLAEGTAVGAPLSGHQDDVEAVSTTTLRGRDVILSAGGDGAIRAWDLAALLGRDTD
ncbi:WD40 repeat domain-containing protein [Streptomyces lasiicapitis]|uniref:hypothetical protein n=1 Tax=Streptomyces lasiicapitis TaxID=1923961 RepID=UPI003653445B